MLCGQTRPLTPALQPPSVSPWPRVTPATGPWRSCCTLVVRDWGAQWASSDLLQDHLGSIVFKHRFLDPKPGGQVICEGGPGGTGRSDLQGLPGTVGLDSWGPETGISLTAVSPPPQSPTSRT